MTSTCQDNRTCFAACGNGNTRIIVKRLFMIDRWVPFIEQESEAPLLVANSGRLTTVLHNDLNCNRTIWLYWLLQGCMGHQDVGAQLFTRRRFHAGKRSISDVSLATNDIPLSNTDNNQSNGEGNSKSALMSVSKPPGASGMQAKMSQTLSDPALDSGDTLVPRCNRGAGVCDRARILETSLNCQRSIGLKLCRL